MYGVHVLFVNHDNCGVNLATNTSCKDINNISVNVIVTNLVGEWIIVCWKLISDIRFVDDRWFDIVFTLFPTSGIV